MEPLNWKEFIKFLEKWVAENQKKIASLWTQKGGWESWAQAEICSSILEVDSRYDILREQHVYTSGGKSADFLLNNSSEVKDKVIIELKCQSFENYKKFTPGLRDDIKKLINELKPAYEGATLLVVGIYFTDKTPIDQYFENVIICSELGICYAMDQNS